MLKEARFTRIVFFTTLAGIAAYAGSLIVFLANNVRLDTTVNDALIVSGARPGVFGSAYLLQGLAFLLWALVPVSVSQRFREDAPGISQLTAIVGGFGFVWRALADLAKAGSMEFLGQVYRTGDASLQLFAEQLATWAQLWTFGAVWELLGNGIAFGIFTLLTGLLLLATDRRILGWTVFSFGVLIASSWIGTATFYVLGLRAGLQWIGAPGYVTLVIAPLWLGWLAWHVQQQPNTEIEITTQPSEAVPEPAT